MLFHSKTMSPVMDRAIVFSVSSSVNDEFTASSSVKAYHSRHIAWSPASGDSESALQSSSG